MKNTENVTRFCYGYFMGELYLYTTECGNNVDLNDKFCKYCGKELIFLKGD